MVVAKPNPLTVAGGQEERPARRAPEGRAREPQRGMRLGPEVEVLGALELVDVGQAHEAMRDRA